MGTSWLGWRFCQNVLLLTVYSCGELEAVAPHRRRPPRAPCVAMNDTKRLDGVFETMIGGIAAGAPLTSKPRGSSGRNLGQGRTV